jgi:glutaredoxin
MLNVITEKLRALAHRGLEESESDGPLVRRVREVANTVNDLLGKPIRAEDATNDSTGAGGPAVVTAAVREQAPVILYFDGKDHRTKTKMEELLHARDIKFSLLDVGNDEAERSWVITAAKRDEFPIVVIAGTPVGGLEELTQLDVQGDLKRRVFGL